VRTLLHDRRGASAIEFALLAPVLLLALLGIFDLAYNLYTQSLLDGVVRSAARNSTLEGASLQTANVDGQITRAMQDIAPAASLTFDRTSYASFSSVNKAEGFTDTNKDNRCDAGEPFEDVNENGVWDADQGRAGAGSSRDVVVYLVTVTYPRPFPVTTLLGTGSTITLRSRTVLGNQPWDNLKQAPTVKNCP